MSFGRNHHTGEVSLDPLRWVSSRTGARIKRRAQTDQCQVRDGRRRRCILPVDGFYEWSAMGGQKGKQPYAIAMKDGQPFGLGGMW